MSWIRDKSLTFIQSICVDIVKSGGVPKHVAFIMDGNRRFAQKNKVKKIEGHTKGFDKLAETLQWCLELGIPEVTVYAFSIENFKRTPEEVENLLDLAREKFKRLIDERQKLSDKSVRIRIIGNLELLPDDLKKIMAEAMEITKNNDRAYLNVAFSYTARDEMTEAIKSIVSGVERRLLLPDDVSQALIDGCLYTRESSNPDLLIRTSGEVRLSDFLLWQISSTCIYFTSVFWPDFSFWNMLAAVMYYQRNTSKLLSIKNAEEQMQNCDERSTKIINILSAERDSLLRSYINL